MEKLQIQPVKAEMIQHRENWLIQNHLDAGQQKIVKFFNNPTVRDVDDSTLKRIIDGSISVSLQDLGKIIEDNEDVKYMVNELFAFLRDKYQAMRIVEIKLAFQRGVAKEYGDYFGFNAATLKIFINKYMADHLRSEALKRFIEIKHKADLIPEPTPEEKEQQAILNITNAFEKHKQTSWYEDFNNVVFLELNRRCPQLFNFQNTDLLSFYKTAKQRLINHYNSDTGITFLLKRERKTRIKQIQDLKQWSEVVEDAEVVSEANKVALNHVFKLMVESGLEIIGVL